MIIDCKIPRYKTAISRNKVSKPVRLALLNNLINKATTVFDYGCGRGKDVEYLNQLDIKSFGYDPYYFPKNDIITSDVVMLNYVINVIENLEERINVIRDSLIISKSILLISVRLKKELPKVFTPFNDGIITRKGTFQKFFDQTELEDWLNKITGFLPIKLTGGIVYLVK